MTARRLPRWSEVAPLIGRPDRTKTSAQRRLARAGSIDDLRLLAIRRVPRPVFDYVDGAAGSESSLNRARDAFARVEFTPRVLRDVSDVDTSTQLAGQRSPLPLALAPTGFTRMMHHVGESAVAQAAADAGLAYGLSTLGTTSPESLAAAVPQARRWFQLYVWRDRDAAEQLVRRVDAAGYDTLILTVDTAVGGIRLRDVRNGLSVPPQLTVSTLARMAVRPRWWMNVLTTEPLQFASLQSTGGTVGDLLTRVFDPALSPEDVAWLRETWRGKLIVKGIQSVDDAKLVADLGVDGVVLSNHGGRQMDKANVPLEILPAVRAVVDPRVEVYIDGGIMSGTDVVAAVAFGATGVLVGRAYLYGLMAGGAEGVRRAIEILDKETRTAMQLLGARSIEELRHAEVRLRPC